MLRARLSTSGSIFPGRCRRTRSAMLTRCGSALSELHPVSGGHHPPAEHGHVEPGPSAFQESPDDVAPPELYPELETGESRLGDNDLRLSHAEAVAGVDRLFGETRGREVLAEHPRGKVHPRKLAAPERRSAHPDRRTRPSPAPRAPRGPPERPRPGSTSGASRGNRRGL
jgi:hypothetical protein